MATVLEGKNKRRDGVKIQEFKSRLENGKLGGAIHIDEPTGTPMLELLIQNEHNHAYSVMMTFAEFQEWQQNAIAAVNAYATGQRETLQ